MKLLLRMTLKEDVFEDDERAEAQQWLTTIEGTRNRRRADVYNAGDKPIERSKKGPKVKFSKGGKSELLKSPKSG